MRSFILFLPRADKNFNSAMVMVAGGWWLVAVFSVCGICAHFQMQRAPANVFIFFSLAGLLRMRELAGCDCDGYRNTQLKQNFGYVVW